MADENTLSEALELTGCKDFADLVDMARIGQSLIETIHLNSKSGFLQGWVPAQDPAEVVVDLLNELDDRPAGVFEEIAAERHRQITEEGWTAGHDDEHVLGELSDAGAAYAAQAAHQIETGVDDITGEARALWPWAREWFKPGPPRRMLIKACALLVAEVQRIDRAGSAKAA